MNDQNDNRIYYIMLATYIVTMVIIYIAFIR